MDDIVISRSDGLYMGYHLATLKISHIDFIFPTLGITRIKNGSGIWRIGTEYANVKKRDYVFLNNLEYWRIQSGEIECYWFNAPLLSFIENDECSRVFYGKGKNHTHILRGDTLDDIFDRIRIEITNKQSFTLLAALTIEFICATEREYANISDFLSDYNPRELSSAERNNH